MMVDISKVAQEYLATLLKKQEGDVMGVRMFVNDPGTPRAETCIAYCRKDDIAKDDELVKYKGFKLWMELRSKPFLKDAKVDFEENPLGGQLTIRAPNAKMPKVSKDSPLEDHVNYVLYNEVNPALASHGGEVSLVEIVKEEDKYVAILRFGGGCQGCGMVDVTLKDGVENTLLSRLPQLKGVRDITDHSDRSQAYM
jgi:Fe/S biogenesis protein NfuA